MAENQINSEWQPARYIDAHPDDDYKPAVVKRLTSMIIRVRPGKPPAYVVKEYRRLGCLANRFFEVSQADADVAHGRPQNGIPYACEHEVLTD